MNHDHYKAYIKLQIPQKENIMGLSQHRFEIIGCEYNFKRKINNVGEPCSEIMGGEIKLSLVNMPADTLMTWMFDHIKRFNGEISIIDAGSSTLEQTYFTNAKCMSIHMHYKLDRAIQTIIELVIWSDCIRIGNTYFEFSKV